MCPNVYWPASLCLYCDDQLAFLVLYGNDATSEGGPAKTPERSTLSMLRPSQQPLGLCVSVATHDARRACLQATICIAYDIEICKN